MKANIARIICVLLAAGLSAEIAPYGGHHVIEYESENYGIIHTHKILEDTFFSQETKMEDWFSDKNNFSGVILYRKQNEYVGFVRDFDNQVLFSIASPLFRNFYIDEENQLVICLSTLKVGNPWHLVVYDMKGKILLKVSLTTDRGESFPVYIVETMTSWIRWYDDNNPEVRTFKNEVGEIILTLNGPKIFDPFYDPEDLEKRKKLTKEELKATITEGSIKDIKDWELEEWFMQNSTGNPHINLTRRIQTEQAD